MNCQFKELDFSTAKNLEKVSIGGKNLEKVSFAQDGNIKELQITNCNGLLTPVVLPANVEIFRLTHWKQQQLPALPTGLRILDCLMLDELTSMPVLPASLTEIKVSMSNLTSFDFTPCKELTTLTLEQNQLHSVKFPTESKLNTISIADNSMSETDMTVFIEALPTVSSGTLTMWSGETPVANHCNTKHVAAAKAKGWNVIDKQGKPYPGITPTGISTPTTVMEDAAPYYDLQGRRIKKPTQSGIYIHNGRKIVVR